MHSAAEQSLCLITGASGYLGGRVAALLQRRGWRVLALTRRPRAGSADVPFQLGDDVAAEALTGAEALVHCAYDRSSTSWEGIRARNVLGSERLFRAARAAKIPRLVFVSTLSAFGGSRSRYGRAKLETEQIAQSLGAIVLRPGLIHGAPPGGIFARLVDRVARARVLPSFGRGGVLRLVHEEDLTGLIGRCVEGTIETPRAPIPVAHRQPWTLRAILEEIARAGGRSVRFVPVPWRALWAVLKCRELCRLPSEFASDSLLSLMHQDPRPSFALLDDLGIACRPFMMTAGSFVAQGGRSRRLGNRR